MRYVRKSDGKRFVEVCRDSYTITLRDEEAGIERKVTHKQLDEWYRKVTPQKIFGYTQGVQA